MKKLKLLLFIPFLMPSFTFAQLVSDYYPMHVGNYWIQQNDTSFVGYQLMVSRTDIEAIDLICNEEYFRMRQENTFDDSSGQHSGHWYIWARFDSTGFVWGAFGDTSIVDSAQIFYTPLPFFPNEALNLGYSWEFDLPGTGIGDQHWDCVVESISETVEVPAGIYNNCIKMNIIITDTLGDTVQTNDFYYAEGIGQVLNEGWSFWWNNMKLELIEYYVQPTVDVKKSSSVPTLFSLEQNYPNPFNPVTTISYELPQESDVTLTIYDITGRLIETLVDQKQNGGQYMVQWEASQYSSGVYIYRIQVEDPARGGAGGFSAVKKCILMK